jgi:hypothetical protein
MRKLLILLFLPLVLSCSDEWSKDDYPDYSDKCIEKMDKLMLFIEDRDDVDMILPGSGKSVCACLRDNKYLKEGISKEDALEEINSLNWDELYKLVLEYKCENEIMVGN